LTQRDAPRGLALAVAAYALWGFLPLYLKAIDHVPVTEILAHRILWSLPVALGVLVWLGRTQDLRAALRSPRLLAMAGLTAALVTANWLTYLYAIQSDQAVEAALGYYINPLFSVLLGAVVLRETLSRAKWLAVGCAAAGVALVTIEAGRVPVLALTLTLSWGFYALAKRALPVGPNQGFTLEVMILCPAALGWLVWLGPGQAILSGSLRDTLLLMGAGVVTAVPLMLYANGAKMIRLSTIAMLQYISPTLVLILAVFVFGEPFSALRFAAFCLIWAGLAVFAQDVWRNG
jgi:chloramphenicol-sensitive protein RarD